MGNQQKHISEVDYRRYLNDELTGEERNTFEKLLQKHPFEAMALEGLQEVSPDEFTRDMDELKQRLGQKTKKSNRMIWWTAAASIVILVSSGILWYNLDQGASVPQVAEQMSTEKSPENPEPEKRKKESVVPVTKAPEKGKGPGKGDKKSMVEPGASVSPEAKVADPVEIKTVENDVETDIVESPDEISDADISTTTPFSKPEPKPANETLIVEDASLLEQTFEENAEVEYNFAEPTSSRQAQGITSGAAQSQITSPTMDAQPMMDEQEFKAWMQSQAVLEKDSEIDSVMVVLNLHVDETGKITKFVNANQADQKYFNKARKIIRTGPPWQPAMVNGFAIKSELELKVNFKKR